MLAHLHHRDPVLLFNDLPAWGRVALAVAVPLLERQGLQTCCLPTALLSSHGGYPGAVIQDQTPFLASALAHLEGLSPGFSAVCTGFVASPQQAALLEPVLDRHRQKGSLILVDPILGDHGRLYGLFGADAVPAMARLVARAHLITPNLTEAALLLGRDPSQVPPDRKGLERWLADLAALGPRWVALTSAPVGNREDGTGVAFHDRRTGQTLFLGHRKADPSFPGTGDYFAAALAGELLVRTRNGQAPAELSWAGACRAVRRATFRVRRAIELTRRTGRDPRQGLYRL